MSEIRIESKPTSWHSKLCANPANLYFGIVTGHEYFHTRAVLAVETWMTQVPKDNAFLFGDLRCPSSCGRIPVIKTSFFSRSPNSSPHARFGRALRWAYNNLPSTMEWFFLGDDDTYVWPPALRLVLGKYDSSQKIYIGQEHPNGHGSFAGGAGWVISRPLLKKLVIEINLSLGHQGPCPNLYTFKTNYDIPTGHCLHALGGRFIHDDAFGNFGLRQFGTGNYSLATAKDPAAISMTRDSLAGLATFHKMPQEELETLYFAQQTLSPSHPCHLIIPDSECTGNTVSTEHAVLQAVEANSGSSQQKQVSPTMQDGENNVALTEPASALGQLGLFSLPKAVDCLYKYIHLDPIKFDSETGEPVYTYRAYEDNGEVGSITFYGRQTLCVSDGRNNIIARTGIFVDMDIDTTTTKALCKALPQTVWEKRLDSARRATLHGAIRGAGNVVEYYAQRKGHSKWTAELAGELTRYGLYFFWSYLRSEGKDDWSAVSTAAFETGMLLAVNSGLSGLQKQLQYAAGSLHKAGHSVFGHTVTKVGDGLPYLTVPIEAAAHGLPTVVSSVALGSSMQWLVKTCGKALVDKITPTSQETSKTGLQCV